MGANQSTSAQRWEQLLVRHAAASKRTNFEALESVLRMPFDVASTSSADGGAPSDDVGPIPTSHFVLAVRFEKLDWLALYASATKADEIYQTNSTSRRVDIVHLGCDPDGVGWFFRLARAGKPAVEFAHLVGRDLPANSEFVGAEPDLVDGCRTGEDVFHRLCEHWGIKLPLPEVRSADSRLQLFADDEGGVAPVATGNLLFTQRSSESDDSPSTGALLAAIEACDLHGIRRAVADGASLTTIPSKRIAPLTLALFRCDRPGGKECVELLAELGAPINGPPGEEPTVISICKQFIAEPLTVKMLEVALPLGIDVNARNASGGTAIFESAVYRRKAVARLLMQYGADATIEDNHRRSALSWVKHLHEKERGYAKREEFAELICILTGKEYTPPVHEPLPPKLAAEMDRLRACTAARQLIAQFPKGAKSPELDQAARTLAAPTIFVGGQPARFERVGYYHDVSRCTDPTESTARLAERDFKDIDEEVDPSWRQAFEWSLKVSSAARLVAMRHLQFAGAPESDDFIQRGCDCAKKCFEFLATTEEDEVRPDNIDDLLEGLLMCALIERWDTFDELCGLATLKLARKDIRDSDDPPVEYANAVLSFVSDFRQAKFPKLDAMEQQVLKGRPKRPKQLLKVWQAARENDPAAFQAAMKTSLKDFSKRKRNFEFYMSMMNAIALPESVMCLAAARRGLEVPSFDPPLADYLVTPESIAYAQHD